MTPSGLLASLVWAAVAAFFVLKLDAYAHRWLSVTHEAKQAPKTVDIPEDLLAFAMQETEKWAQDATLKVIRERYESFQDWNKVRSAVGIGELA